MHNVPSKTTPLLTSIHKRVLDAAAKSMLPSTDTHNSQNNLGLSASGTPRLSLINISSAEPDVESTTANIQAGDLPLKHNNSQDNPEVVLDSTRRPITENFTASDAGQPAAAAGASTVQQDLRGHFSTSVADKTSEVSSAPLTWAPITRTTLYLPLNTDDFAAVRDPQSGRKQILGIAAYRNTSRVILFHFLRYFIHAIFFF
jgi:hypothetical protein